MRQKFFVFVFIFSFLLAADNLYSQRRSSLNQVTRTITVITEPKASIWVDGVLRGETDDSGKLEIKPVMRGTRKLRVRANGFKEVRRNLLPRQKGTVKVNLVKTNDQAVLAFQEAEKLMATSKTKAIESYERAIKLRPRFPQAYVGLARALSAMDAHEEALKMVKKARLYRRTYPEASAVEGRIYNEIGEYDKAIDSYDRAIREGRGFQPEAHTGLGLLFKDEAESAKADNDAEDEEYYYGLAAKSLEKAINQLSGTEAVVYLFLGKIYEETGDKKKAIAVYERFLRDMPDHEETSAVESFIVQLKKPEMTPQD